MECDNDTTEQDLTHALELLHTDANQHKLLFAISVFVENNYDYVVIATEEHTALVSDAEDMIRYRNEVTYLQDRLDVAIGELRAAADRLDK